MLNIHSFITILFVFWFFFFSNWTFWTLCFSKTWIDTKLNQFYSFFLLLFSDWINDERYHFIFTVSTRQHVNYTPLASMVTNYWYDHENKMIKETSSYDKYAYINICPRMNNSNSKLIFCFAVDFWIICQNLYGNLLWNDFFLKILIDPSNITPFPKKIIL